MGPAVVDLIDCDFSINLVENLDEEEHKNAGKKVIKKLELIHPQFKTGVFGISYIKNNFTPFYSAHYESLSHEIILPPPEYGILS
ncbi:hypothetical protein SCB49_05055 [unidentified eubacterium SCB49]|nr:hypothetical protein SCB49_05055 [unidentified eubacterium SCB49]